MREKDDHSAAKYMLLDMEIIIANYCAGYNTSTRYKSHMYTLKGIYLLKQSLHRRSAPMYCIVSTESCLALITSEPAANYRQTA